jgi:hypothetical protein
MFHGHAMVCDGCFVGGGLDATRTSPHGVVLQLHGREETHDR